MAAKRGSSGLSLVVAVDKPLGLTSHDVVGRCRRVFGEKRVGHTGTLDPMASGVLPVCVGPATRLASYLTSEEKAYEVSIAFGASTDTDDAQGRVLHRGGVPEILEDEAFAQTLLHGLLGRSMQLPPVYSAIKVGGTKSYEAARKGQVIDLQPRPIEVMSAQLAGIGPAVGAEGGEFLSWRVLLRVSKGTYIRSLARDIGLKVDCPAHVAQLRRVASGSITLDDCASLEALERLGEGAALDPVRKLGYRFFYGNEGDVASAVTHGRAIPAPAVELFDYLRRSAQEQLCACTSGVCESCSPPADGERFSVIAENKLKAVYAYRGARQAFVPECVFQIGVSRGCDIYR